ncbi:uncharacterized protein LOC131068203 [Cryptomeria japonica]|uniref:uncharacterized protein LOC131068203 n=1 Tax=Cryptomeria japonica TaxID=3369 RepID=UPI0027DA830D|nr:uncharacterized protein LOC131068203 [Cryptomeria japonica]
MDPISEGHADKEGFTLVKPRNKGKGKKRTWMDRQNDDTFNKFDVLEDLVQEEGILVELSSGVKVQGGMQDGDFNVVTSLEEKSGGLVRLDLASNLLRDNIGFLNLIDVKPTNGVFTWNNRRSGVEAISKRLDRFLDLMAVWWHEGMLAHGRAMYTFGKRLQHVKYRLKRWNKQCLGNLHAQKFAAQSQLDTITRQIQDQGMFPDLSKVGSLALKELEEWELCEDVFWKQKSHVDWLQEGDRNTSFFHNFVKARRYGNFITSLVSSGGSHFSSREDIAREAVRTF